MVKFPITSKFQATEPFRDFAHLGIDLGFPRDTQLYAVEDSIISKILTEGNGSGLGNAVFMKVKNGQELVFAHLNSVNVEIGEKVSAGTLVGRSGNSGRTVGENGGFHLHVGLKDTNGQWVNPEQYIPLIQNMDQLDNQINVQSWRLDPSDMLNQAMDSLTIHTSQLLDVYTMSQAIRTILSLIS